MLQGLPVRVEVGPHDVAGGSCMVLSKSKSAAHYAQGVPVRVEVGPRDVASGSCVVSRRDRPGKEGKAFGVPAEPAAFVAHVSGLLDEVQARS